MSDPGSAAGILQGAGSVASAFGAGGGGGGGGGGMVVGGPTPGAAMEAGYMQSEAARLAGVEASKSVADAIASINQNYGKARYSVQPYRTEGVQALNQLNQYLGLNAYDPGAAPKAPEAPNLQKFIDDTSHAEVLNYIYGNSNPIGKDGQGGRVYRGVGSGPGGMTPEQWQAASAKSPYAQGNAGLEAQIKAELARNPYNNAMTIYNSQQEAYNQDLAEYNKNKEMYDKYSAEGPLTSQQIADRMAGQPGYQAELSQGVDAIGKNASAAGYLGSGRILKELNNFGQNTLSKYYSNTLDRLQNLVTTGQQAATGTSANYQNQGNTNAQAHIGLGDTLANSRLAIGNAQSQAMLAANQEYKIIGGSSGGGGK